MPEQMSQDLWDELNDKAKTTDPAVSMQCQLPDGAYLCVCNDVGVKVITEKAVMYWSMQVTEDDPSGLAGEDGSEFEHVRWLTGSDSTFGIALAMGDVVRMGIAKITLNEIRDNEEQPWPAIVELAKQTGVGKTMKVRVVTNDQGYKNTAIVGVV